MIKIFQKKSAFIVNCFINYEPEKTIKKCAQISASRKGEDSSRGFGFVRKPKTDQRAL